MKNSAIGLSLVFLFLAVSCTGATVKTINPEEDSIVIGRVKHMVLFFEKGEGIIADMDKDDYDKTNLNEFELRNPFIGKAFSGKNYKVKMNADGYFVQKREPGGYLFQYNTSGRNYSSKSGKKKGSIELKYFTVPKQSIVNIGTFIVIAEKKEASFSGKYGIKFVPDQGPTSFSDPLTWFKSNNPGVCDAYGERIVSK